MIRLENVHKAFASGHAALGGVDLEVARGEVFGIIGRSGAGKSTLVRLLNGLERPSTGTVSIDGTNVSSLSGEGLRTLRRRVGMIFQNFGLLSSRTVFDNVALPLRIAGADKARIAERVPELLARVGLIDHGGKYPAQLSGGQKQRVGIARALATGPDILLCDEATSALDPETTRSILTLIADLNRELGLTIVLITHEMEVVRQVCDRVAVLHAGRVVETGSVAQVFLDPKAAETRAMLDEGSDHAAPIAFDGPIIRLTLRGDAILQPVLTRIARETGTDFAILDGRIGRFKDASFGQLTLGLTGGDTAAALAALRQHGEVSE
ncbi:methionine ABC transporter ATP-binding protein [Sphingomonas kyeonggiensis]|uniref:Cell division ATP-binding protein FtsE n=1 Tax=Sphingomonas kyeonggiensis TaxID=1268553 RepID=A0A7W6JSC9_9SPHN|nr:ATP-binding cassette domain-containing protein [Sphingomonas kyeonggiensis]MBB4098714.1 D-methionine transport system ATP-binding protein [Sphingomonas kyeonggiensis]